MSHHQTNNHPVLTDVRIREISHPADGCGARNIPRHKRFFPRTTFSLDTICRSLETQSCHKQQTLHKIIVYCFWNFASIFFTESTSCSSSLLSSILIISAFFWTEL
jgi:hypothetical protein